MKKILFALIALIFILVILLTSCLIAAPVINDNISKKTAKALVELPLPEDTELVESVYKAGKLIGNGNGMQYFGAILIKSQLSFEELEKYYSGFAENEWDCVVEKQTDGHIKMIEHGELSFQTDITGDDYYMVYSWGDNDTIFHELDIRGH